MAEVWRLCTTWDLDPALNMGLDEVLGLEGDDPRPVLRFYTWKPDTLSLGYFQKLADVPAAAEAAAVVRRVTGGGAIHHTEELTFSIGAPQDAPLFRGPVGDSYARVHGLLARALARFGIQAALRGERGLRSDTQGTGMCFHDSTDLDLVWDDRKGVGSAQRRTQGRILHHGSIKLGTSRWDTGVGEVPGISPEEMRAAILAVFEEEGISFEEQPPRESELERARLRGERYRDPTFLGRR